MGQSKSIDAKIGLHFVLGMVLKLSGTITPPRRGCSKTYTIDCSVVPHYQIDRNLLYMKRFFVNHTRLMEQGGGDVSTVVSPSLLVIYCAKLVTMKMRKTILFRFKKNRESFFRHTRFHPMIV